MIEVEIKLAVKDPEDLKKKLLENGFQRGKIVREEDVYFNSDHHDFRKRDEALRIRSVRNLESGKEQTLLTFKGPKIDQVSMTRKELETGIESLPVMREVLMNLGFDKQYPVIKTRAYYEKENLTACVDQVERLGDFLELEVLVEEETGKESALLFIEETLKHLGHDLKETTRTSYLTMLMEKDLAAE